MYLAAVIDWHSKAILSHKLSNTMDSTRVMAVLKDAIATCGILEMFNTDQGSQYMSHIHTRFLSDNGIQISTDGKGGATDNMAIERFWGTAKYKHIYLSDHKSIRTLKAQIDNYITFYNRRRFCQPLSYEKPMEVYHTRR